MQPILTANYFRRNSEHFQVQLLCSGFTDAVKTADLIVMLLKMRNDMLIFEPTKSIGDLSFLCSYNKMRSVLGKPTRSETLPYDRLVDFYSGQIGSTVYHKKHGFVGATIYKGPVLVDGFNIFSKSSSDLICYFKERKIEHLVIFDDFDKDDVNEIDVHDWHTFLYFDDGKLEEMEVAKGIWENGKLKEM